MNHSTRFADITRLLDLPSLESKLVELNTTSSHPDFWSNEQNAKSTMSQISRIRSTLDETGELERQIKSLEELKVLNQENSDPQLASEIQILDAQIEKRLAKLELLTFLSGKYDKSEAILSIHSGQGGTEAMDWAGMLSRMYQRYFEQKGWPFELVDQSPGEEAGIKSVTFIIHAQFAFGFLQHERGTHRLVRLSPFNADNLRQTSFAGVEVTPLLDETADIIIRDEDLEFEASRSTGAGGQNVNKVNTAVRLRHLPTNIVVQCQTQRYQEQNRKIALQLLKAKLWELEETKRIQELSQIKGEHKLASWGNQIRSYVLHPYKLVKDLRTDLESTDPDSVLDGSLDQFIEKEIKFFATSNLVH